MERYKIVVAKGYTTWCLAKNHKDAIMFALKRYSHITKDIVVTYDPVKEEETK